MSNLEELEITRTQRFAGNITAGTMTVLCGLFLLLCGVGVISLSVGKILAAAVLFTIGFVFLVTGLIQKNTVSIWLAFVFLIPALIEVLAKFTELKYSNLYPLYIAIPAAASLVTMLYSREWRAHILPIVFFGATAVFFALNSFGLLKWGVVLPLLIVFIGFCIIFYAVRLTKSGEDK